jgi:hypothetical protein
MNGRVRHGVLSWLPTVPIKNKSSIGSKIVGAGASESYSIDGVIALVFVNAGHRVLAAANNQHGEQECTARGFCTLNHVYYLSVVDSEDKDGRKKART